MGPRKTNSPDAFSTWFDRQADSVRDSVADVHRRAAGRELEVIRAALYDAGIDGPEDVLGELARRISAADRSTLPPDGVPYMHVRARFAHIKEERG